MPKRDEVLLKRYEILLKREELLFERCEVLPKRHEIPLKRYEVLLKRQDVLLGRGEPGSRRAEMAGKKNLGKSTSGTISNCRPRSWRLLLGAAVSRQTKQTLRKRKQHGTQTEEIRNSPEG